MYVSILVSNACVVLGVCMGVPLLIMDIDINSES